MPAESADGGFRLIDFAPAHLRALAMGGHERAVLGRFDLDRCIAHWPEGIAFSAVDGGRVLGCAGLTARGGDAIAWAVLSDELRGRPVVLHRAVLRGLKRYAPRFGRIRATVLCGHAPGHRWLRALGFGPVRRLAGYGPNGEDFMEYER